MRIYSNRYLPVTNTGQNLTDAIHVTLSYTRDHMQASKTPPSVNLLAEMGSPRAPRHTESPRGHVGYMWASLLICYRV